MIDTANNGREAFNVPKNQCTSTETPRVLTLYVEMTLNITCEEDVTEYTSHVE